MPCTKGCCDTQREHWLSVGIAPSATPTRSGAAQINATEDQWSKDMDAYKSMRRQGLQPRGIDGADHLAAIATDPLEIEMGRKLPGSAKEIREGIQRAQDIAEGAA